MAASLARRLPVGRVRPAAAASTTAAATAAAAAGAARGKGALGPRDRAYYPFFLDLQTRWASDELRGLARLRGAVPPSHDCAVQCRWIRSALMSWSDNDQYGHVNNSVYYFYFDTVVNWWLIHRCGLQPTGGDVIGLVAETRCAYHASVAYPDLLQLGLAVTHVGRTSVQYQIGVFRARPAASVPGAAPPVAASSAPAESATATAGQAEEDRAAAVGHFVHVYVDAHTRRPHVVPDRIRAGLAPLLVPPPLDPAKL